MTPNYRNIYVAMTAKTAMFQANRIIHPGHPTGKLLFGFPGKKSIMYRGDQVLMPADAS